MSLTLVNLIEPDSIELSDHRSENGIRKPAVVERRFTVFREGLEKSLLFGRWVGHDDKRVEDERGLMVTKGGCRKRE